MSIYNPVKFFSTIEPGSRLLGLDVGDKRIGLAISDQGLKFANPFSILKRNKFKFVVDNLITIIKKEEIGGFIIGWPLNMDGTEGPRCDSTRDFAHAFLRRFEIPICFQDERLSSIAVEKIMIKADMTRKKRESRQDALAASWILQSILDTFNNNNLN